ncbi:MAG: hypothetical protein R3324_12065, partial [Halobacteriales archaeon]|nr:hypothetical protein [Halobacteriales archaeon]
MPGPLDDIEFLARSGNRVAVLEAVGQQEVDGGGVPERGRVVARSRAGLRGGGNGGRVGRGG